MDLKHGDKIIVCWPPGPNGKHQSAYVLLVPETGRSYFQIQFEAGRQKRTFTVDDLQSIFVSIELHGLRVSIGDALDAKKPALTRPAEIGSRVTIQRPDKSIREYSLVPDGQGNQANHELDSTIPIGAALLGCSKGDEVEVNGFQIKILEVVAPDEPIKPVETIKTSSAINYKSLESDKAAVICGELDENMIVMSPPGTGKSFTLTHKTAYFVEKKKLSPGEILILSFSREAVAEVKRRLQIFSAPNISLVQPYTIDSFAASILLNDRRKYFFESYEKSITDAKKSLTKEALGRFKHIFIDEFQDIVGIRADFVIKILELKPLGCGATLLGDLEQAIYHWSLKGQESQKRSEEFLLSASQTLGTGQNLKYLTKNFRINCQDLKDTVSEFRSFLEKDASNITSDLISLCQGLKSKIKKLPKVEYDGLEKYSNEIRPEIGIRKCILFRDNGQLIAESALVHKLKIKPKILGKYNRGLLPTWYATLMKDFYSKGTFIDRDSDFEEWFRQRHFEDGWDSTNAWNLLKGIEGSAGHSKNIDLVMLKKKIQYLRDIPMPEGELRELHEASLVFSTYHASKGLEFERVYLVEPEFSGFRNKSDFLDEARMFYVGLTRAKQEIKILPKEHVESLRSSAYLMGRAEERRWYRNESDTRLFNVDNEFDVEASSFIMPFGFNDIDEIQLLLFTSVKEGDAVVLKLCEPPRSGFFKTYFIFWKGKALGAMSKSFYDSMLKLFRRSPPLEIHATIGRKYSEFRYNSYGSYPLDELHSTHYESWHALKLGGLAKAVR